MSIFDALTISASAMQAERQRAETVAANMANAQTTRTEAGGAFHRRQVVFQSASATPFQLALAHQPGYAGPIPGSVSVSDVVDDPTPPVLRYEPGHPDANADGYVAYPAINPAMEMVDMMSAVRAYQLNAAAANATKQMIQQSIDILKS
jgi:flagellar basal-body rod protein FlgC